jgi:hypothetical protein
VVKASYFPNWRASGADGPYRLAPNLMVVVPREREVTLTYGLTAVDWLGRLLTLLGIAGLVALGWWKGWRRYRAEPADDDAARAAGDAADEGAPGASEPPDGGDRDGDGGDGAGHGGEPPPERTEPAPALP